MIVRCMAAVLVVAFAQPAAAQDVTVDAVAADTTSASATATDPRAADRVLGVLPNFGTIEPGMSVAPISRGSMLEAAAKNTFDPVIFPFIGVTTAFGRHGATPYMQRYATAFADNAIANFMTSAVFPSVFSQDPRYYQRGRDGDGRRALYAASRILVTHSSTGRAEFNYSEVLGNLTAGAIANAYYAPSGRSLGATLSRWGTQVVWDAVSNELKEFWPDIRQHLRSSHR